jgi:hypothetical protein
LGSFAEMRLIWQKWRLCLLFKQKALSKVIRGAASGLIPVRTQAFRGLIRGNQNITVWAQTQNHVDRATTGFGAHDV